MTIVECSRLQSMSDLSYLLARKGRPYKALGNAANVDVIRRVAAALLQLASSRLSLEPQKLADGRVVVFNAG
jgi:site-specific DNA-cytosine methylase